MNEYDLEMIGLKGILSNVLGTKEEVMAFYERLAKATSERFREFERARRASELEAHFIYLD